MNIIDAIKDGFFLFLNPQKATVPSWYSFRRTYIMPESEYKRTLLKNLSKVYKYRCFVETGTYLGDTTLAMQKIFNKIFTIELSELFFSFAKNKLSAFSNINMIHGDSAIEMKNIVGSIDTPTIFFLDGHYSGAGTALGEKTHPIMEELSAIAGSKIKNHVVVIDDISDFTAADGNIKFSEVIAALEGINPNYKFYSDYDMLFALPYEDEPREFWKKIAPAFVVR